jgi:hypothetical protein
LSFKVGNSAAKLKKKNVLLDTLKGTFGRMRVTHYEINIFHDKVESSVHLPTSIQKARKRDCGP